MKLTLAIHWCNAAWRESARAGSRELDVDHLYLGLVALGGAAARLLGRHGISLASARERVREAQAADLSMLGIEGALLQLPPRALKDLGDPDMQFTSRARALCDRLSKAPDTFAILVGLLKESDAVRRLLDADGVAPNDLVQELRAGSDDPLVADRVPPAAGVLPEPARGLRITRFVSVAPEHLADVLADPASLAWWAYDPAHAEVSAGGEFVRLARGKREITVRFHLSRHEDGANHQVSWLQELTDGEYAGQPLRHDRFDITPAPGGCELTRTTSYRLFKLSGRLLAPVIERATALSAVHALQFIAYGAAEAPTPR